MTHANRTWIAPAALDEALGALTDQPAVVLAGGTDLWPQWAGEAQKPDRVVSLHRLAELQTIDEQDGWLTIGACCTHSDLVHSEAARRCCPSLPAAAATIGAVQIQNQGTVGGNVVNASPAADLPPSLLAAGAELELASTRGRRTVPIRRFYRGYRDVDLVADELLVAVRVPCLPAGGREHFRKVGTRRAQAISKVVGAARLVIDRGGTITAAGLALGSVAAVPQPLSELEQWLVGRPADPDTADEAERRTLEMVHPIDDLRSSADYRRHVCGRLVHGWLTRKDLI